MKKRLDIATDHAGTLDFKELTFTLGVKLSKSELDQISSVFAKHPLTDIDYKIENQELFVYLRSLDLGVFTRDVKLTQSIDYSDNTVGLLNDVARRIESIKSYGVKGSKRIYVGYNNERKVKDRKEKEGNRAKYFYANIHEFSKSNVELPLEYENKIVCADCNEVLDELPDNCIDLILTSPPYNFGLDYDSNYDANRWAEYFDWLYEVLNKCIRVLKYGGRLVVNVQPLFSDYIPSHHLISSYLMSRGLIWKGELLWEKNNYNCKYTAWGSWKSPSNPYLKYTWEFLEVFSKGTLKKEGNSGTADITSDEFKKWVVAKWSIAPEKNMKKFEHPAMFPEELVRRVVKLFSFPGDVVLDPFNGVGTTTFVARRLNRKYLGIDISKDYCSKAEERLQSVLF